MNLMLQRLKPEVALAPQLARAHEHTLELTDHPEYQIMVPKQFDYMSYFNLKQFQIQQQFTKSGQARIDLTEMMGWNRHAQQAEPGDPNYSKQMRQLSVCTEVEQMKKIQINFEKMNANLRRNMTMEISKHDADQKNDKRQKGHELDNFLSQMTQPAECQGYRSLEQYYNQNPKARPPSSYDEGSQTEVSQSGDLRDEEMQFDEPADDEQHYMNEMRAREENIIKNFLYDPSKGQQQHREQAQQRSSGHHQQLMDP